MAGGGVNENAVSNDKYIIIYDWIHQYLKLNGNEAEAFALIYSFHQKEGFFGGSFKYISERLYIPMRTAHRILNKLEEKKYITKEKGDFKARNKYFVNMEYISSLVPFLNKGQNVTSANYSLLTKCHEGTDKMSLGVLTKCHPSNKYSIKDSIKSSSSIEATATGFEEKEKHTPSNELKDVCQMYQREITQKISCSPFEIERLQKLISVYNADKVKNAIEIAVMRNKKSLSYIEGVLKTPDKQIAGTAPPQSETTAPKEPYYQPPNLSEY
ncbi:DnaD domain protein [Megamonas hypermegale]|uniref:DnaD domain protein n=1 Tax=Megamonas hypermegale TaxID=158847 RepID=UPI001957F2B3|nr:DnaD domain protein [Megamonas hypermegale]MBM6761469.1 DnaD domain protein [Megamonas hypermegale]